MKMIYLANARIPTEKAHGLQIMKMCQAFVKQKVDLELIVAKRINPQFKGVDPFEYYQIKEKFPIKRLFLIDMVALGRSLKGLSVIIQNTSFAISSFLYLLFKKTDIIYSRDEFSLFFLSFFKKNLVLEMHIFPNSKLFLYKRVFKKTKKIIAINNKLKELVINLGIEPEKILVAHDGVDLEQFDIKESKEECRKKLSLPLDKKIILYSGHFYQWKGVYALAEASRYLGNDCLMVLVGGLEKDKTKLEKFIQEKELDKILLIEHQPPYLIPFYLKAADVLVLPNSIKKKISRFYTSPVKMFEYMASGIPIVASDLPSIREVLNEENSILFKADNPSDLAEKIKLAFNNQKITQRALIDVQRYTWQKRTKDILEFILK